MRLARSVISVDSRPSEGLCLRDAFIVGTCNFERERERGQFTSSQITCAENGGDEVRSLRRSYYGDAAGDWSAASRVESLE